MNKNVTSFSDIHFKPHPLGDGVSAQVKFDNGYGVSIIKGSFSYGGNNGLYEIAVLDENDKLCYSTPITDDVIGFLNEDGVTEVLKQIQQL
jgi:hypothetical protein